MKVVIKKFQIEMEVKSRGIEFEVRSPDGSEQKGDCYITKAALVWCIGKAIKENGTKISWEDFMEIMKSDESKKAALKAAKAI